MDSKKRNRIQQLIDRGYSFQIGEYLSEAFSIFQQKMGPFIGFVLIYFLLSNFIGSIPYVGAVAIYLLIEPIFITGIYLYAHKVVKKEAVRFEDFFSGFAHINPIIFTAALMNGILLLTLSPFIYYAQEFGLIDWYMSLPQNPELMYAIPEFPEWILWLLLPALYLRIAYSWVYLFLVFYQTTPWDSLELSLQLITRKLFIVFVFMLMCGLIGLSGALLLFVGLLFTVPPVIIANYVAFSKVTQLKLEGEEDITDHLID